MIRGCAVAVLLVLGCGGNLREPPTGQPDAESGVERFGGTWSGFNGFIVGDRPVVNYAQTIRITTANGVANVEWLCSIGTTSIQMVYGNDELHLDGALECPASNIDGCMTAVRLTDARALLTESGTLALSAHGMASMTASDGGCVDGPAPLYYSLHATR